MKCLAQSLAHPGWRAPISDSFPGVCWEIHPPTPQPCYHTWNASQRYNSGLEAPAFSGLISFKETGSSLLPSPTSSSLGHHASLYFKR